MADGVTTKGLAWSVKHNWCLDCQERQELPPKRPDWDAYFLGIAQAVSKRADCTRRKVGAVIVKRNRIVSTGYNGAPAGDKGCLTDGACPRGWMTYDECSPLSPYGNCVAVHAEANSLLYADRDKCEGATLYLNGEQGPCLDCTKLIRGAGIARVVCNGGTCEL